MNLSKSVRRVFQTLFQKQQEFFSLNAAQLDQIVNLDPTKPIQIIKPNFLEDKQPIYKLSKLENNLTIITEQPQFPFHLDLGMLCKVGSKNETVETSGSLFLIKQLHLVYGNDPNYILKNFEKIQFSGCQLNMCYDQENTYWKCSCIPEDKEQLLDLMFKTTLVDKNFSMMDSSILKENTLIPPTIDELIFQAAFGQQGLGMPIKGGNHQMSEKQFLTFQQSNFSPDNFIISASGVSSHESFVDLIKNKLKEYPQFTKRRGHTPVPSKYVGGELRQNSETDDVHIGIVFQSFPWHHQNMTLMNVINTILGNSSSFSTGGPGKGMHSRSTKNLVNNYYYVESASSFNQHFRETGLFGIKISGPNGNCNELIDAAILELKQLTQPISQEELERGKNILKSLICLSLERQSDRLEEITKNIYSFGRIKVSEYSSEIQSITGEQINQVVASLLKSQPTIVIYGKNANKAYSWDQIQAKLKA